MGQARFREKQKNKISELTSKVADLQLQLQLQHADMASESASFLQSLYPEGYEGVLEFSDNSYQVKRPIQISIDFPGEFTADSATFVGLRRRC